MRLTSIMGSVMACAAISCAIHGLAFANDGIGGVDTENIRLGHTDKVAMAKEVLDIGPNEISVDYAFLNESDKDVHESLVFPLPPYHVQDDGGDGSYIGQPHGFRILVEGQEKPFSTNVTAMIGKENITPQLRALGLTDRQIAFLPGSGEPFDAKVTAFTPAQTTALQQKKWMAGDSPAWDVSVAYVWYLTFPAGKIVHVHHSYRPFPTIGIGTVIKSSAELQKEFCADDAFLARWRAVSALADADTQERHSNAWYIGYILKTGNTWKDGIRDFTLRLHRKTPAGLVSTCFPVEGKDIDPLTREYHITNFHPAHDLSIYFGNLPDALPEPSTAHLPPLIPANQ